ncbi:MAG: valine--tRNA ligase [Deltaproteobacteria bacterium]|nr:valine--tRNA ligase [Deltaproteobacteria bacterium]
MNPNTLAKAYEPHAVEDRWLRAWDDAGAFRADPASPGEAFSIVIPPPNVTGSLHIGHALNNTLQDVLARYHRMNGHNVLWVPGTDHAGIATQNVVERQLAAEGTSREDLGREAFIERVWTWKAESGGRILAQLRRLGASCDFSRERFTMDDGLSRAVREVFVRLFEEGLIYRGNYIINWCPRCRTALSALEVEREERAGHLWHLRYPFADGSGAVSVATTRPETMLGDTAVAVHPDDERYTARVGARVVLPIVGREIAIVADPVVSREFGTGAVKVTPAHDFNDFELGLRHGLDVVRVLDLDAKMTAEAGAYHGLDRYEARKRVVADLDALGALERVEDYKLGVGVCYRCKTVVEPMVSKQWFVKTGPLAERALAAVKDGRTHIIPVQWEKTYYEWMENIRDWCISRQIWWGHQIPAWTCEGCGELIVSRRDPTSCPKCGGVKLTRETDVLDTWFSSALWPFSTLGWPDQTPDLTRYYPTTVLVTAFDILFFWVARMMMMGLHFMGEVPFRDVYIHALVRDAEGQKMSKSKGNVVDPLEVMSRFGTDALRFTLTALAAQGRDIKLAEERIEGYRHFMNKLWNAARFCYLHLDRVGEVPPGSSAALTLADRWILSRLQNATESIRASIEAFRFNDAALRVYSFVWSEFCDWYIELAKHDLAHDAPDERRATARAVLARVLGDILKLAHPFMPFITEELWSAMPGQGGFLTHAPFPRVEAERVDRTAEDTMETLIEIVKRIRDVRAQLGVSPRMATEVQVVTHDAERAERLARDSEVLRRSVAISELAIVPEGGRPAGAVTSVVGSVTVHVGIGEGADIAAIRERLGKDLATARVDHDHHARKLGNEGFVARAPEDVVEKERAGLAGALERIERIEAMLGILEESGL